MIRQVKEHMTVRISSDFLGFVWLRESGQRLLKGIVEKLGFVATSQELQIEFRKKIQLIRKFGCKAENAIDATGDKASPHSWSVSRVWRNEQV